MKWRTLSALLSGLLLSSSGAAASPGQWRAGAGLGAVVSEEVDAGAAAQLSMSYGVSESVELLLDASLIQVPGWSRTSSRLAAGAVYQFDVLRWVPHLGATAGVGGNVDGEPGIVLGALLGVDYLMSRRWSLGAQYRAEFGDLSSSWVHTSQLFARVGVHWGY